MTTTQPAPESTRTQDRSDDHRMLLQIYLNDHRAGAAGALAMLRRSAGSNQGTPLGATLEALIDEIEADAETLDRVFDHLDLTPNRAKQLLAKAAERVGRLKMNGRLRGYSPLSRVIEIEGLLAGIDAKRKLWLALRALTLNGSMDDIDLCALSERAESQRERLISHHHEAVLQAFGKPDEDTTDS